MALIHSSNSPQICSFHGKPISRNFVLPPLSLSFPLYSTRFPVNFAAKTEPDGDGAGRSSTEAIAYGSPRKRVASPAADEKPEKEYSNDTSDKKADGDGDTWVDWEDKILEDTVPLVGFVRMILHSGRYESGDRLSPEHEKTILERLLAYHPEYAKKIGCGVDYITIGYHPDFGSSRCLFIARKNGELEDFSYWKCLKGLIRKKYPLYADSFILKHFRRRRRND